MDTKRLKHFSEKYLLLQKMKHEQKELQAWLDNEQSFLIDHLIDEGVDKVSLAGGVTIFIKTMIWAKYEDKKSAVDAIKQSDIKDLIEENFHSGRLASYLRELDKEGKDLPPSFDGIIKPNHVQTLIARKI